jgi:hypothetical protein
MVGPQGAWEWDDDALFNGTKIGYDETPIANYFLNYS